MTDVVQRPATDEDRLALLDELDDLAAMLGSVDGLRDRMGEVLRALLRGPKEVRWSAEELADRITAAGMKCSWHNVNYLAHSRGKRRRQANGT